MIGLYLKPPGLRNPKHATVKLQVLDVNKNCIQLDEKRFFQPPTSATVVVFCEMPTCQILSNSDKFHLSHSLATGLH